MTVNITKSLGSTTCGAFFLLGVALDNQIPHNSTNDKWVASIKQSWPLKPHSGSQKLFERIGGIKITSTSYNTSLCVSQSKFG